jgi:hypothetical protein
MMRKTAETVSNDIIHARNVMIYRQVFFKIIKLTNDVLIDCKCISKIYTGAESTGPPRVLLLVS